MAAPRADHLTPATLEDFLAGQLTAGAKQDLLDHLGVCPRCRDDLNERIGFDEIRKAIARQPAQAFRWGPRPAARATPQVPNYDVQSYLGGGGFGEVWLAHHTPLNQPRALKFLHTDHLNERGFAALRDEARLMAALPLHHNRVLVYEFIEPAGGPVLAMAYVKGGPLSQQVLPMHWERAVRYVADAAEGLAEVHARGILHRDVKPANLLLDDERDAALLSDYGLAAHADRQHSWGGTLGYMAPEVLEYRPASVKSDVFALAATLFHLVVGEPPFRRTDHATCLAEARLGLTRSAPGVPQGVVEAIHAGLEPDPERRPGLDEFRALVRRAHLWKLADDLRRLPVGATHPTQLKVTLAAADQREKKFQPLFSCTNQDAPPEPVAHVRTGDLLQFVAQADLDGYVTVLNFSSTGQLDVLLPNPVNKNNALKVGSPHCLTVKLTPPATTDRFAVVWTRDRSKLGEDWRRRILEVTEAEAEDPTMRGAAVVDHRILDWTAVVVTVQHREKGD